MTLQETGKAGLFCVLGGLCFTVPAMGTGNFGWWWLSGVLTAAAFFPVLRFGPRNLFVQFGCISLSLIVVGLICTMSEGVLFYPEMKSKLAQSVIGGSILYLLAALLLVAMARVLKLASTSVVEVEHRSMPVSILMVLLSGLSYLVYYFVFGAITFVFFTKQYYPHAAEQVAALGNWFWGYQLARGVLMTLAVLPLIYTLRLRRWHAAVVVGLLVWIVGGAAPLVVPSPLMVPAQRYMHIVEIMTQNVSLGITAVLLLRRKALIAMKNPERAVIA